MKLFYYLLLPLLLLFAACSSDSDALSSDTANDVVGETSILANVPITNLTVPNNFVLGETYTLDFSYILPSACYYYESLDYSVVNSTEIILAVEVYVDLVSNCDQVETEGENSFVITIQEVQDYTFKLWKGTNSDGDDVFEEIIVPVSILN